MVGLRLRAAVQSHVVLVLFESVHCALVKQLTLLGLRLQVVLLFILCPLLVLLFALLLAFRRLSRGGVQVVSTFHEFVEVRSHLLELLKLQLELYEFIILLFFFFVVDDFADGLLVRCQDLLSLDAGALDVDLLGCCLLLLGIERILEKHLVGHLLHLFLLRFANLLLDFVCLLIQQFLDLVLYFINFQVLLGLYFLQVHVQTVLLKQVRIDWLLFVSIDQLLYL